MNTPKQSYYSQVLAVQDHAGFFMKGDYSYWKRERIETPEGNELIEVPCICDKCFEKKVQAWIEDPFDLGEVT